MTNCLIVIGWLITAILSYIVGEKLHFTQRRKEKLEKFENTLTAYSLLWKFKPSEKYERFTLNFILMDEPARFQWLKENKITEIKDFYDWLGRKVPQYESFYNKFKEEG